MPIASTTVDADTKRALATYAYKTVLLLRLQVTPRKQWLRSVLDQCSLLYQIRRPPVGVRVWIGRFDLRENFPDTVHGGRLSEVQFHQQGRVYVGQQVIFTLGQLLIFVVFWNGAAPDDFIVESERLAPKSLIYVWPALVQLESWPPPVSITYAMLNNLMNWNAEKWTEP